MLQQTSEKDLLNCWRAIARLAREFFGGSLVGSGCILAGGGFGIALSVFGEGDGFIAVLGDGFLMVRGRGDGFITALGDDRIMVLDDGFITAFGRGDDRIMVLDDGLITAFGRGDGFITAFGRGDDLIMVLDDDLITALRESVIIGFGRGDDLITALRDETTGCVMDGLFLDCTRLPSGIDCASPFTGGAFPLLISTVDFSCWYGT